MAWYMTLVYMIFGWMGLQLSVLFIAMYYMGAFQTAKVEDKKIGGKKMLCIEQSDSEYSIGSKLTGIVKELSSVTGPENSVYLALSLGYFMMQSMGHRSENFRQFLTLYGVLLETKEDEERAQKYIENSLDFKIVEIPNMVTYGTTQPISFIRWYSSLTIFKKVTDIIYGKDGALKDEQSKFGVLGHYFDWRKEDGKNKVYYFTTHSLSGDKIEEIYEEKNWGQNEDTSDSTDANKDKKE